ncbi:MAG: Mg(2+) transport ATPase protein [Bryobacterales bacterium]|jgi:putative Mg2+ transporter-C (MgtC) family protein|nr:Mg(2+) transport ATPase protein [Bryobacterales bacterium]
MESSWLRWWTDQIPLVQQQTFPRLLIALVLGGIIGVERQWRQRAAGMRTNTLVCFGAAAFVDLGITIGGPNSTNVIAYVVSGVGFLGAGAIMKDGGSIRGLNTAATLWCSAAVGACAGAGEMLDAVFVTALLVGINILFRPLSRFIDRRSLAQKIESIDEPVIYQIGAVCPASRETQVRALLLKAVAERPLLLRELRSEDIGETDDVFLRAEVEASHRENDLLEQVATELRSDEDVTKAEWSELGAESE